MKRSLNLLVVLCIGALPLDAVAAGADKAIKLVVTLLTGAGAAKALENAAEAKEVYSQKDAIIQNLRSQGIDPTDGAIYSVYVKCDPEASAIKWSRIFSMPNLFIVADIEGQGTMLLPRIQMDYRGQPILENLIAKNAAPGQRILIYVLDDKEFQNRIWNSILQTKIRFNVAAGVTALRACSLAAQADGALQVLDRDVVILPPGYLATAEFRVPESSTGSWLAEANFLDKQQRPVGKLQFAQIWKANPAISPERSAASSKYVFWAAIAVVLFLVFGKLLLSKPATA